MSINVAMMKKGERQRQAECKMVICDDLSGRLTIDSSLWRFIANSARLYLWPMIAIATMGSALVLQISWVPSLAVAWAVCCCASFGFLINDLWDQDIDRANMRLRLTRLRTRGKTWAIGVAFLFAMAGIGAVYLIHSSMVAPIMSLLFALIAYSAIWRKILLLATVSSAIIACAIFWVPIWSAGVAARVPFWMQLLIIGMFAFHSGREIMLDIKDVSGDRIGNRLTIPILFGLEVSFFTASILIVFGVGTVYIATLSVHVYAAWALLLVVVLLTVATFNMTQRILDIKRLDFRHNAIEEFAAASRLLMFMVAGFPWLMLMQK